MMIMSAFNQKLGGKKDVGKRADHVTRKTIQIKPLPFFFFSFQVVILKTVYMEELYTRKEVFLNLFFFLIICTKCYNKKQSAIIPDS